MSDFNAKMQVLVSGV